MSSYEELKRRVAMLKQVDREETMARKAVAAQENAEVARAKATMFAKEKENDERLHAAKKALHAATERSQAMRKQYESEVKRLQQKLDEEKARHALHGDAREAAFAEMADVVEARLTAALAAKQDELEAMQAALAAKDEETASTLRKEKQWMKEAVAEKTEAFEARLVQQTAHLASDDGPRRMMMGPYFIDARAVD